MSIHFGGVGKHEAPLVVKMMSINMKGKAIFPNKCQTVPTWFRAVAIVSKYMPLPSPLELMTGSVADNRTNDKPGSNHRKPLFQIAKFVVV